MSTPSTRVRDGRHHRRAERRRAAAGTGSGTATSPHRSRRTFVLLFAVVVVLSLIGLVMVLSASSVTALHDYGSTWYYFLRQLVWVVVGAVGLGVTMTVDYRRWRALATPLLLLAASLLVLVLVMGVEVNGSQRWLGFGDIRIQPSEFAKLAVLIFTADLLARRADRMDRTEVTLRPILVVLGGFGALILLQPNLGTTLLLCAIVLTMLFVAGTPLRSLGGVMALGAGSAVVLALAAPYRRARLLAFLDPWSDPQNTGYQTIQSQVATASGGLTGVGLGASRAKWEFLPFAHTDFIFAVIAEELGMIGALLVLALFVAFGALGVDVAMRAPDPFGMLLAAGVTAWILVQAFVNIGAVVGVLPITGVPLPFVSFGGSSMVVTMVAAGLLLNVARHAR